MSILLASYSDIYQKRVAKLLCNSNLPISTVVTPDVSFFNDVKEKKITFYDMYDFYYADKIRSLRKRQNNPDRALSSSEIKIFYELESQFLKISDRLSFFPLSVHQRLEIYYNLLNFWLDYFEHTEISLVVFPQTPHTGYDNVIFFVAQQLNIKVAMFTPTSIGTYTYLSSDYRKTLTLPQSLLKINSKKELLSKISQDVYKHAYNLGAWQKIGRDINTKVMDNFQGNAGYRVISRNFLAFLKDPFSFLSKFTQRSVNSGFIYNTPITFFQEQLVTVFYYVLRRKLLSAYQERTSKVDLSKKFVYVALHYQPERTTMPEGDVFEDQYLAIALLSSALPRGWLIYVKEHPREFSPTDIRTRHFRSIDYYDRVLSLSNVYLVPLTQDSQELIEKSQFTASVQGTVGWESLTMHKPTMVFANAWYGACQSAFKVTSTQECRNAITQIRKKTKKSVELDMLRFLVYIQKHLIAASFYEKQAQKSSEDYQVQLNTMVKAVAKFYEKNCLKKHSQK